jgi:transposase
MAGRKSKYTPENVKTIVNAIEQGVPYRHAAAMVGVDEDTLLNWRKRHSDFAESIKAAEGRAVAGRLARIRQAEPDHWQAAAWWLERKYPQEFGKTVQEQQHTGKDGEPLEILFRRSETK